MSATGDQTPDIPRLRKVLEHITAHPEQHNQAYWATRDQETLCNTAMCLAGHTVYQAGYDIVFREDEFYSHFCRTANSGEQSVSTAAAKLLGLNINEAVALFSKNNTLDDLWRIAEELADRAGERL